MQAPTFRETLWFKAGNFDHEDEAARDRFEQTPIDVRYADDGSKVTLADSVQFGVHTGVTQPLPRIAQLVAPDPAAVAEIARELSRLRAKFYVAVGGVVAAGVALFMLAR